MWDRIREPYIHHNHQMKVLKAKFESTKQRYSFLDNLPPPSTKMKEARSMIDIINSLRQDVQNSSSAYPIGMRLSAMTIMAKILRGFSLDR